jgi:hypothetical protein
MIENSFIVKIDFNFFKDPTKKKSCLTVDKQCFTNYQKKIYILVIKQN